MSKKLAMASIAFLIIGGIALPGGFLLNTVIDDTVAREVDTGLTGIKDQATPIIENMVSDLGSAEVLSQIRGTAVPVIEGMVSELGVAEVLNQINSTATPIVQDMVKQLGVAEVLHQINETAIPIVYNMVKELGVAEVLNQINETAIPIVEQMVHQIGSAESLARIRETALPFVEEIVNATFLTQLLYNAYLEGEEQSQMGVSGGDCLLNMFFDYQEVDLGTFGGGVTSFSAELEAAGLPPLLGVSQWYGSDLEIGSFSGGLIPSPDPPDTLAWGDGDIPGVMQNLDVGTGVLEYLENYDNAVGNATLQNEMCSDYDIGNDEFWKLGVFTDYIRDYWVPVAIPTLVAELQDPNSETSARMPEYQGMDTDDIAYYSFLKQWANCSQFVGGMDFHEVSEEFPVGTYGFEVNRPDPSGISIDACYALWDETDGLALTNMDSMETWFAANSSSDARNTLLTHFPELTASQLDLILDWLWGGSGSFSEYLVPMLVESSQGYGIPIEDLAQKLFMEQWTNGSILNEVMYEGGLDFGEMVDGIPEGAVGFEVGYQGPGEAVIPSNMTVDIVEQLWDGSNPYSLFNMDGMQYWVDAQDNEGNKSLLISEFGLTETQMTMILNWLWEGEDCFSEHLVPILAESEEGYGMPLNDLAQLLFMEQWANGSILNEVMYEGGLDFGEMVDGIPKGTTGFEVGYQGPGEDVISTGMTGEVCTQLWNGSNPYSLFNMDGMQYWVDAQENETIKTMLIDEFGLTETQMNMILDWLWEGEDCFSEHLVPILAESEEGYGMPLEDLAELLFKELWSNGTILGEVLYEGGLDFGEMVEGIPEGSIGFEVGVPEPTNMTADVVTQLWNGSNPYSLFNMDGMQYWVDAQENETIKTMLINEFDLTDVQMDMILDWLWEGEDSFSAHLVPILAESEQGYGIPLDELAAHLLYEQWTNGTILGEKMYEGGLDFHEFIPSLPVGTTGFEVGVPDPTGISLESAIALWDETNPRSLLSMEGMEEWLAAKEDEGIKEDLQIEFGLTIQQMDAILCWLWEGEDCFSKKLLPILIESDYGYGVSISEFSFYLLLEQWANGSIMGDKMYPDGLDFGEFIEEIPEGTVGFEVGLPDPTGMSRESALALWNQDSEYSLVNDKGLEKWWSVVENKDSNHYATLKEENGLTDKQMNMLIEWLPQFKNDVMPQLAKYEMDLPTDTTTLGNYVMFGGMLIGGACIGLASVGLVRNRRVKKKAMKKIRKKQSKSMLQFPEEGKKKGKLEKSKSTAEESEAHWSKADADESGEIDTEPQETTEQTEKQETEFEFMQDVDYDEEME
ncbi:MAG: hypothetical protein ACOC44_05665 [Promethearchaeia archaeon]